MKKKIGIIIQARLGSKRLPAKALLPISGLPLVVHTYRRANLSKYLNSKKNKQLMKIL